MSNQTPLVRIVCRTCGSENVMRDAWARWNPETQAWELGSVFDDAYCEDCDGETDLDELVIRPVFEITAAGYFAGSDMTDNRVLWVEADNAEQVAETIAGLGAFLCRSLVTAPDLEDINFKLPADADALRERLQHFRDNPPEPIED